MPPGEMIERKDCESYQWPDEIVSETSAAGQAAGNRASFGRPLSKDWRIQTIFWRQKATFH
jgi:hypothetical protein